MDLYLHGRGHRLRPEVPQGSAVHRAEPTLPHGFSRSLPISPVREPVRRLNLRPMRRSYVRAYGIVRVRARSARIERVEVAALLEQDAEVVRMAELSVGR